jgi:uroporphyrinogen decarboxylase
MSNLKNDCFIKALLREPTNRTPIWIMRQAGRYLPEYREIRKSAGDFLSLCKNTELATEVTLQPIRRFPLDAAILFSDILTIPDAMGLGLYFSEGEGPKFESPITNSSQIDNLPTNIIDDLSYVTDAVSSIRKALDNSIPLIGFSGSPWTLSTYMVEGQSCKEFKKIKSLLYKDPVALHNLLDKLTITVIDYLNAQVESGAQVLQIFDTWGGILSDDAYLNFSLRYIKKVIDGLIKEHDNQKVPVIVFTKGGYPWLKKISECGCDAIGLDWSSNIRDAREQVGSKVALQGNMDPSILRSSIGVIESEVQRILSSFGQHDTNSGHVFNLGHGITPDIDPEHVSALVEAVKKFSTDYHR